MATTITEAFVQHFGSDFKMEYQRMTARLRSTVRKRNFQPGEKTRFYKSGVIADTFKTKGRHSEITPFNVGPSYEDVVLTDYYGGDWIDEFDEDKITIDERRRLARLIAAAKARTVDGIIRDAMYASAGSGGGGGGLPKFSSSTAQTVNYANMLGLREELAGNDVPFEGQVFCAVGPKTWSKLMQIEQFVNQDYIPADQLVIATGMNMKPWLGINWFEWTGIQQDGTGDERNLLYHMETIGYASRGDDAVEGEGEGSPNLDFDWNGTRRAWFVSDGFEGGATTIENAGGLEWVADVT